MKNLHSQLVHVCMYIMVYVLHNIINNIFDVSYDMGIKFMRTYLYVNLYDISTYIILSSYLYILAILSSTYYVT